MNMKRFLAIVVFLGILALFSPALAAPPSVTGGSHPPISASGQVTSLMSDLSVLSVSLAQPIKEGDKVGNSLFTILVKNGGPGIVKEFTVKITCHAIRGTVPTGLLSTEKKITQLLPANGQTNVTWPAPSSGKWTVGDYRLLVEVKSDRDKNAQNNAQYFVFKVPPAVPTAIKVISPNGGEVLYKGRTYKVTWTFTGHPNVPVNVVLVSVNDVTHTYLIGDKVPLGQNGAGSFSWTIPSNIERRTDYKMFVGNGGYTVDFLDSSNGTFTVTEFVH